MMSRWLAVGRDQRQLQVLQLGALLTKMDDDTDDTFERFGEDDCRRGQISGTRENAGIAHGKDESRILDYQDDEGDVLHGDSAEQRSVA